MKVFLSLFMIGLQYSMAYQVSDRLATQYNLPLEQFLIISQSLYNSSPSIKPVGQDIVSFSERSSLRYHLSVAHFFIIPPVEKE